jgi:hypothetical protein
VASMTFAILPGTNILCMYGPISIRNWIMLPRKKCGYPATNVSPTHWEIRLCLLSKVSVTVSSEPERRNFSDSQIALAALYDTCFFPVDIGRSERSSLSPSAFNGRADCRRQFVAQALPIVRALWAATEILCLDDIFL